jgi:predicted permease
MRSIRAFFLRVSGLFNKSHIERELTEEIESHLQMTVEDNIRSGMTLAEARRVAVIESGGLESAKEAYRDRQGLPWLEHFFQDLRYAGRVLRKSPGFAAVAIATLALGIGANTAVFSIVDAVLLRPLPYPQSERLGAVATHWVQHGEKFTSDWEDGRTWELLRDHAGNLDCAVFAPGATKVNFAAQGQVRYVMQQRVSEGYFRVLGVQPLYGREFTRDEDRDGGPAVAVLGYGLWKNVLHGDESVLQHTIMLRGERFTVVGIMPPEFRTSTLAEVWTPLRPSTHGEGESRNYGIAVRLRPGVTWAEADSQIAAIGAIRIKEKKLDPDTTARLGVISFQQYLGQDIRKALVILWIAVAMVLLIGCVNIASLLLARAAGRTREIATRMALGGGRAVVFRQLLTESLLLALLGGAVGVVLGYLGVCGLEFLARDSFNLWQTVRLDGRVLLMTSTVTLSACLLFGLYPAWQGTRGEIRDALAESGGRGVAGGRSRWPRRVLVVAEVTLSVALLIGAGLLLRTFTYLRDLQPGFDPNGVLTATLSLQDARYQTAAQVNRLFDQSLERIRELPGVEAAAVGLALPYERGINSNFQLPTGRAEDDHTAVVFYVTPDYFRALRIPVLGGRAFTQADGPQAAKVVVVNEAFASLYFPRRNPMGMHIKGGEDDLEIIGLVGNIPMEASSVGGYAPLAAVPVVFFPVAQEPDDLLRLAHMWFSPSWIVRTSAPPKAIMAGMQRAMQSVEPLLPFSGFRELSEVKSKTLGSERLETTLMGTMAGLALLLAAIGIYGLIAHSVSERTREIGIRMAMGATAGQAVTLVTLPGVVLAGIGCALGCMLGWGAAGWMRHLIWGVSPTDTATFVGVSGLFLFVAAVASLLPAWSITRLNPANTLRSE